MPERPLPAHRTAVLVPLKSFARAKSRLATALEDQERSSFARAMAERVLHATGTLDAFVVCDDAEVAAFARMHGAGVVWTPGLGLNAALEVGVAAVSDAGHGRVVIAAGDLPFAHDLAHLEALADHPVPGDAVVVVPDRHREGTNVLSFRTGEAVKVAFGPGSLQRHRAAARDAGLPLVELRDEALGWDIDTAADLDPPAHLGALPLPVRFSTAGPSAIDEAPRSPGRTL